MSDRDVAREAALLVANGPDRQTLAIAADRMRDLDAGIRHDGERWHVSRRARAVIGTVAPELAKARFAHAFAVLSLALSWLDQPMRAA